MDESSFDKGESSTPVPAWPNFKSIRGVYAVRGFAVDPIDLKNLSDAARLYELALCSPLPPIIDFTWPVLKSITTDDIWGCFIPFSSVHSPRFI